MQAGVKYVCQTAVKLLDLYIKIVRFVRLTGYVSECRTAGMPIMSHCQPYADRAALRLMLLFSVVAIAPGRRSACANVYTDV